MLFDDMFEVYYVLGWGYVDGKILFLIIIFGVNCLL